MVRNDVVAVVTSPHTGVARHCGRASVAIFLNMLKIIAVENVGHWIANGLQCTRCAIVRVVVMSLCP